ncbi:MAG: SIMPL domain-containing protein [Candidatus Faecivicinus sp.]
MKRWMIVLLALVLFGTTTALAETTTLTVRGTGVVGVTADVAQIVLGVREVSTDVREAQATVNEKINAICDALIEAGVDQKDIGTESLYIYANYDYSGDEQRLTGYTASNTISITTSQIDSVGAYIDIAFEGGANTLDSVDFSSRDNEDAQKEALELAVQNAYEKAEVIANAAGMEIVAVKSFDESEQSYSVDTGAKYSNARIEAGTGDQSTRVQASSLQIQATVLVEFELSKGDS